MQDNINSPSPGGRRAFFCPNQDKPLCKSCITIPEENTHTNSLVVVTPVVITPSISNEDLDEWSNLGIYDFSSLDHLGFQKQASTCEN